MFIVSAVNYQHEQKNLPKRSYFQRWTEPRESGISILEETLKNQVVAERRKQGRHEATTFLIIDAQSVKNTDTAMEKATMRARRLAVSSGI